jgi:hypothetical protein
MAPSTPEDGRNAVAKRRVWELIVVEIAPFLNDQLGLLTADKPFPLQAFIA